MNLEACPHCGRDIGVYQAVQITGRGRRWWDNAEDVSTTDIPRLKLAPHSDVVRCLSCRRIRRDWMVVDGELVRGRQQ